MTQNQIPVVGNKTEHSVVVQIKLSTMWYKRIERWLNSYQTTTVRVSVELIARRIGHTCMHITISSTDPNELKRTISDLKRAALVDYRIPHCVSLDTE